jgi:hypothetical protein
MAQKTVKSIPPGLRLEQITLKPYHETTEKQVAASILSRDEYLDKYTDLGKDEIHMLDRLETMADSLDGSWPGVDVSYMKFYCKKHKRHKVSFKAGGAERIVRIYAAEEEKKKEERTLKDRLMHGSGSS